MIVGACAGSTGGGFKVSRIVILCKYAKNELERLIHPRTVKVVKVDGKQVSKETVHGVLVYTLFYILIAMASMLLVSLDNFDASTTISSVLATLNNIGPGRRTGRLLCRAVRPVQSRPVPGHAGRTAGNLPPFGASPAQHLGQEIMEHGLPQRVFLLAAGHVVILVHQHIDKPTFFCHVPRSAWSRP